MASPHILHQIYPLIKRFLIIIKLIQHLNQTLLILSIKDETMEAKIHTSKVTFLKKVGKTINPISLNE